MAKTRAARMRRRGEAMRVVKIVGLVLATAMIGTREASAQNRDNLLDGALIGAGVGAAGGVAFTHAVRDSDLSVGQYAYGALVFAGIGAGAGIGVDALMHRNATGSPTRRRVLIAPMVWRDTRRVAVHWRW